MEPLITRADVNTTRAPRPAAPMEIESVPTVSVRTPNRIQWYAPLTPVAEQRANESSFRPFRRVEEVLPIRNRALILLALVGVLFGVPAGRGGELVEQIPFTVEDPNVTAVVEHR